jgi:hypothetical protein
LPLGRAGVSDVGEYAAHRRLLDELRVRLVDQDDHRTGRLLHDLLDQAERVIGALAEAHQRDVGARPSRDRADVVNVDLPGDHLVAEASDDRRDKRKPVPALVRDQNAQMLCIPITQTVDRMALLSWW